MTSRRSFPRLIDASLVVVYSDGAGVAQKGRLRYRKAIFTTISVYVDAIYSFVWMRQYAALRYVFTIRTHVQGHVMHIAAIMLSILRRQNP